MRPVAAELAGCRSTALVLLMIEYVSGNIVESSAEALVNTVNTVGIMGKGIALAFKQAYPENYEAYRKACGDGDVEVGRMFVYENRALVGPKWIINFPTKMHWRNPSRLEWVERGLQDLRRVIEDRGIRSIALPPLGCGHGGLDWTDVSALIQRYLGDLEDVHIQVYAPTSEYRKPSKRNGVERLTPARALIAEAIRHYWILGIECTVLEVQKLAWFLERSVLTVELPNKLDLRFSADRYGPYSDRLRHLLDSLDGTYLECTKRIADAGPLDSIWFRNDRRIAVLEYLERGEGSEYLQAFELMTKVIDGFESPLGMELLSTVDWLVFTRSAKASVPAVVDSLASWPGGKDAAERKRKIFSERMIRLAVERLSSDEWSRSYAG